MFSECCENMSSAVVVDAFVCSNVRLTGDLWQLVANAPDIARTVQPGQFVHISLGDTSRHVLRRPLSVHAVLGSVTGEPDSLSFLYQVVGEGTSYLTTIREGATLSLLGPLGQGWRVPQEAHKLLLVGGGVGWAPLAMLAEEYLQRGYVVHLLVGARNADYLNALVNPHVLADTYSPERCFLHLATDDGSLGFNGFNTGLLDDVLSANNIDYIATCGPEPMQKVVAAQAAKRKIPCEVSLERRMGCGIGACLSCAVKTTGGIKRSCVDGPVFDATEVLW